MDAFIDNVTQWFSRYCSRRHNKVLHLLKTILYFKNKGLEITIFKPIELVGNSGLMFF
jgi:hypothetical protein